MNHYSKVFLVLLAIVGIAFPFTGVVQASNGVGSQPVNNSLPDEPVPDGQGGNATPTPIRVRMNGSANATYTAVAPTIDGDWSDWSSSEVSARFVVVGGQNRSGIQDLDASYKLAWDEYALYIAAKIRDDKYVQNARIDQIYKGDSIEILVDTDFYGDFDNTTLNNDDYQIVLSPGHGSPSGPKESYVFYPANVAGPRDDIDIATIRNKGITRMEVAIPWTTFNIQPRNNAKFGFAFGVSDNDDATQDIQQTFLSNIRKRSLANPSTWGDLTLTGRTINAPEPTSSGTTDTTSSTPVPTCSKSILEYTWQNDVQNVALGAPVDVTKQGGLMRLKYLKVFGSTNTFTINVDGQVSNTYLLAPGGYIVFGTPDTELHQVKFTVNGGADKLVITEFVSANSSAYCNFP